LISYHTVKKKASEKFEIRELLGSIPAPSWFNEGGRDSAFMLM
jgi:hypothetical protein